MFRNLSRLPNFLKELNVNQSNILKRNAGHSKWANIRHTKGLKDAQRSSLFTRLSRQIKVAIYEGGSIDPKHNIKLEQILEQAKRANMPSATVQSVIRSSQTDKVKCKSYMIDIKGPGSCFILCEVFTDNIHHFKQNMATLLKKYGCKFSEGVGKHVFEQKGIIETNIPDNLQNVIEVATDHAIESGAEDLQLLQEENVLQFICGPSNLKSVIEALEKLNYQIVNGSVEYIPIKTQVLSDVELEQCSALLTRLENLPEVSKLSDNVA